MKTTVFAWLMAAACLSNTSAFAANSNPMSQSYDAVNKGHTMTGKRDVEKMNNQAPADQRGAATRKRRDM